MKNQNKASLGLCAIAGIASAHVIHNGTPENRPEYAGVGQILPSATHSRCTATLISRNAILTAAQCFQDPSLNPRYEFALDVDHRAEVTGFLFHPEYLGDFGSNPSFDIALAVLDKTKRKHWDALPRAALRTTLLPTDTDALAIGFGDTANGAGAGERQSGVLRVTGYVDGADNFGNSIPRAFVEVIPISGLDQMICPGDMGGPLYVDGEVAGIASFRAVGICDEYSPGYFLAPNRLLGWILDTLNEIDPPGACSCNDNDAFATREGGCNDLATGLVWSSAVKDFRFGLTHGEALAHADGLWEAGRNDWRLPSLAEARQMDLDQRRHPGSIEAGRIVWTSDFLGDFASAWDFCLHRSWTLPRSQRLGCISVRAAL